MYSTIERAGGICAKNLMKAESSRETASTDRAEVAEKIAIEASRLARIANANEFPMLAYLIEMVVLEAWREASGPDEFDQAEPPVLVDCS